MIIEHADKKKIGARITPQERYKRFIGSNKSYKISKEFDLNSENVFKYYDNLAIEQKKLLSAYDLNIIYYFMNNMFKRYIAKKENILRIVEACSSMNSQHIAFKNIKTIQ